nr:universal stress protein [Brevibacterium ravenspurgense]
MLRHRGAGGERVGSASCAVGECGPGYSRVQERQTFYRECYVKISGDVVVGIDGSGSSRKAAQFAVDNFTQDAPIDLVTVIKTERPAGDYEHNLPGTFTTVGTPEEREKGEAAIERVMSKLVIPDGASVKSRVLFGDPAEELDKCGMDAGLLVIGHHGSDQPVAGRIGTVSRGLPGHALCPVLIHRPVDDSEDSEDSRDERPVIVGMDTSEYSAVAALDAAEFAQRAGVPLQVVVATGTLENSDRANSQVDFDLTWLRSEFRDLKASAKFVESSNPVEALAEASADAQLLCIGKRGVNLFHGMAVQLGRAAAGLVTEARSSLLLSTFRDDPRLASRRIIN